MAAEHVNRVLVPMGQHADAMDSMSINGVVAHYDAHQLIVIEPGDREEHAPNRPFYIHAPRFQWNVLNIHGGVDEAARAAVERICADAFIFGRQTEECEARILGGLIEAEERVVALERRAANLEAQLAEKDTNLKRQDMHFRAEIRKLRLEHAAYVNQVNATL